MPTALLALAINPCHYRETDERGPEYMTRTKQLFKCKKCFDFNNCWSEKFTELFKKEQKEIIKEEFDKFLREKKRKKS